MQFWDLFQWWNLIFTLPFAIGLIPFLLQAAGASLFAHGVHHVHMGHHLPHPGHSSVAAHAHVSPSASGAHAQPAAGPHAHSEAPGISSRLLGMLGIGKVPIMLLLSIFCLIWGLTGVAANQIFSHILRAPAAYVAPSAFLAFLVSYFSTGALSQWISTVMPEVETYGTDEEELVGRIARAAYELSARPGSAFLLDDRQNRVQVRCRTHDGSTIPRGAEVLLLEYHPPSRIFTVARLQREESPAGAQPRLPREPLDSSEPQPLEHPALQQHKTKLP
jgi:hypothetical protein